MKAMTFSKFGGPEVLKFLDVADPLAGPDEVVIKTHSIGVNFADVYRRRGEYDLEPPSPFVLGHEAAGIINSVGAGVSNFKVGDRVAFAHVPRSNAEYVRAPSWKVIPLPDDISFDTAAGILLQGMTAHYLAHDSYNILPGDTVLIHAVSGGVGLLLAQIAKLRGARVIGTISSESKRKAAELAGVDEVLIRSEKNWLKRVNELTQNKGVDVVYDGLGVTLNDSISVTRSQGTIVYFGWAGGTPPAIDPNLLMGASKRLIGGELWSHISNREDLLNRAGQLFKWIRERKISVRIFEKIPLSLAFEAHRKLESGKTYGKILLTCPS